MKNKITSFKNLNNQINTFNQLKGEITKASFEELALGYECLKPYEKSVAELTKAVRDEIVNNKFNSNNIGIKEDKNGNPTYGNLILTTKKSINLDEKYAKELLKKKKLQSRVLEKIPKISNPTQFIKEVKEVLKNAGCKEIVFQALEDEYIQYSIEVNKEKYNNLILDEKLPVEDRELLKEAYVENSIKILNIAKSR